MVTPHPHPRVMLVNPPWINSPGVWVGNSTTIATTPVPNRINTRVPRNSAVNSASSENSGFVMVILSLIRRERRRGSITTNGLDQGGQTQAHATTRALFTLGVGDGD